MKEQGISILRRTKFFLGTLGLAFFLIAVESNVSKKTLKPEIESNIISGQHTALLTDAPNVPPHEQYTGHQKVIVNLEIVEKVMRLADGVDYVFWTFGGRVPGKFIRIREGDEVELHLANHPNNKMPHNIDLHAVSGIGGGAEASLTAPGHISTFSFKALNPGLYVYHCATAPVGMHIANGMYGLILVEPKEGLPKADHEFYIMQGDFYTKGKFGEQGLQTFDMDKAIKEEPEYVVFNGSVGANAGDSALHAKVGETVRIFVGNGGPNLTSSFHVIGEIFDKVYVEGGTAVSKNIQTTSIPPGGSAIVEFKCDVPGTLNIVDHAIFRTFNKGALAQIKVSGEANKEIYSGKISDELYKEQSPVTAALFAGEKKAEPVLALNMSEQIKAGKNLFLANCAACHMKDGQGLPGNYPPLANSDYLKGRKDKGIGILLKGLSGKVKVNGHDFDSQMPQLSLNDDEIANILTYVRVGLCNIGDVVTREEVKKLRKNL